MFNTVTRKTWAVRDILLDTNFLTAPFQLNLDVFEEFREKYPGCEFYTVDRVVEEAKSIESGKYTDLVPQLMESQNVKVIETEGGLADDLLLELSRDFLVATNDAELRDRITDSDRPVAFIRSKSYVEVENDRMLP